MMSLSSQGTSEISGGLGPVEFILVLAVLAVLIFLFYKLVFWATRFTQRVRSAPGSHAVAPSTAQEILQDRYSRGEITREQYEQMRRDLEG